MRILHEHLHELRILFTELMDGNGHVPLRKLQTAVANVAGGWGLEPDTVKGLLLPEGFLTSENTITKDASGELMLSRGEFLVALDGRAVEKRVCRTIQLHLAEVKKQFYVRASASGIPCVGDSDAQVSGTDSLELCMSGYAPAVQHASVCIHGVKE